MKVPIDELYMAYDIPVSDKALLRDMIGAYPYRAKDDLLVELARVFLDGGDLRKLILTNRLEYTVKVGMPGYFLCDLNTFEYLNGTDPENWPPVRCRYVPVIELGRPLITRLCVWDGGHRIALALALGLTEIEAEITPFDEINVSGSHIYGHSRPYQTLVFPHGVIEGMRGTERWALLWPRDLVGKVIGDFGCNSGTDGIMALLCGARFYHGFEKDKKSAHYGRMMVGRWGLADRAKFSVGELPPEVPKFDTLFLFSIAQRIPSDVLLAAVASAGPEVIYLETHQGLDAPSSNLMGALGYRWQYLGSVPQSRTSKARRFIYRGARHE